MAATWGLRQLFAIGAKENEKCAENQAVGDLVEIGDFRIDTHEGADL